MSSLLDENEQMDEPRKIYLADDGRYIVRDLNGAVQEGKVQDQIDALELKLNDPIFKTVVINNASKNGYIPSKMWTYIKLTAQWAESEWGYIRNKGVAYLENLFEQCQENIFVAVANVSSNTGKNGSTPNKGAL